MYLFDGYWEDIGTIRSFYQANLALAAPHPPFDLSYGRGADLHAARGSWLPRDWRGHGEGQPDRRRLPSAKGGDRKQRRRLALPDRPQREDSQFGDHGGRFLRIARRNGGRPAQAGLPWASVTRR